MRHTSLLFCHYTLKCLMYGSFQNAIPSCLVTHYRYHSMYMYLWQPYLTMYFVVSQVSVQVPGVSVHVVSICSLHSGLFHRCLHCIYNTGLSPNSRLSSVYTSFSASVKLYRPELYTLKLSTTHSKLPFCVCAPHLNG